MLLSRPNLRKISPLWKRYQPIPQKNHDVAFIAFDLNPSTYPTIVLGNCFEVGEKIF